MIILWQAIINGCYWIEGIREIVKKFVGEAMKKEAERMEQLAREVAEEDAQNFFGQVRLVILGLMFVHSLLFSYLCIVVRYTINTSTLQLFL